MLYEFKTFTAPHSGAMGPLMGTVEASLPFFEKHGVRVVGVWTTIQTISPNCNQVSFILQWDDLGHWQDGWTAMRNDEGWQAAFEKVTGGDLSVIQSAGNFMMSPASFSPLQ